VFEQLLLAMPEPMATALVIGLLIIGVGAALGLGAALFQDDTRPHVPVDAADEARRRSLRAMQERRR
jgi:hypothetical protein